MRRLGLVGSRARKPGPSVARYTRRVTIPGLPDDAFLRSNSAGGALVNKYRPCRLAEVLGQPDVTDTLRDFVDRPYSCALLFHGESGTGKTSAAIALAHELGVAVEERELGGLFEIASGTQTTEQVKRLLELLRYRPLRGSGWRVVIVNECDRMGLPVETLWLDALEHLPRDTVIVFTTNDASRLSRRFKDRCEEYHFQHHTERIGPWIQALVQRVWEQEGGSGACPSLDSLGMPTLEGEDSMHASFRLALQQLQKLTRRVPLAS
jgi:replication-associated recombination protein RarA